MLLYCFFILIEIITCINVIARFCSGTSVIFFLFTFMHFFFIHSFVEMKLNKNIALLISQQVIFKMFLPIITTLMTCFNYVATLCSTIYHCETCCHQSNVIVEVIDKLLVNKRVCKYKETSIDS